MLYSYVSCISHWAGKAQIFCGSDHPQIYSRFFVFILRSVSTNVFYQNCAFIYETCVYDQNG
ncbi:hypothetical protein OBV_16330 [Oscillibacter valericigenes Sjm18-20]|nr:hypothetical protein OBV_16330 [Oscillibacter valericigenes Sjm18-20]